MDAARYRTMNTSALFPQEVKNVPDVYQLFQRWRRCGPMAASRREARGWSPLSRSIGARFPECGDGAWLHGRPRRLRTGRGGPGGAPSPRASDRNKRYIFAGFQKGSGNRKLLDEPRRRFCRPLLTEGVPTMSTVFMRSQASTHARSLLVSPEGLARSPATLARGLGAGRAERPCAEGHGHLAQRDSCACMRYPGRRHARRHGR